GEIPEALLNGQDETARKAVRRYADIFGPDRFYIEIQDHGIADERRVLPQLVRLALEMELPLVATNDVHYLRRDDAEAQEVLMCIQTGKTLEDENRMRLSGQELYLKTPEEMERLFPQWPDAIGNTRSIAERCHVNFDFDTIHLPAYPLRENASAAELLREQCELGLDKLYGSNDQEARERMDYELAMIERMGYVDYFLITWDFIRFAKENGIMVGPGRGSGAGSIVAYTLGITGVDPIRYKLIFERFLNPDRITMPDFDIDFCYERRQEVIDYVARKYGEDHVAQIITFGTMAAKAVIRDVGRVLGYPYAEVDAVAKSIPFALDITLDKALEANPEFRAKYASDERAKRLIDMARLLEGMPRHASTHAAGVLITKRPAYEYVPLQKNDDVITTQFPMGILERLGLLKMDFLGLRTLTVIRDTLDMMRESAGLAMEPEDIPLDDPAAYEMIASGDTDGVFQLESAGMRTFLTNMKPSCFEDIIAAISLYRPGPMDSIPRYVECKRDPSKVRYIDDKLRPILDVTYGCIIYQEQVMQIVRELAGYSLGRSDLVRRAMAKKKKDTMAQERAYFIHGLIENGEVVVPGAVRNGVSEQNAALIFDEMTAFASYAFNKSHATGYGVLSVQTAWLKVHYPVQFMAALMNSVTGNTAKVAQYIQYCRAHGITVLPPDVCSSRRKFSVDTDLEPGKTAIRFGLGAIKGAGHSAVEAIVRERSASGIYRDIFDFARRAPVEHVNKRVVESLIRAGAFDGTGINRAQLLYVYETALDGAASVRKKNVAGQLSLFGGELEEHALVSAPPAYPDLKEYPKRELLAMEKEVTGVYISGHPLDEYRETLELLDFSTRDTADMVESEDHGIVFDGRRTSMGGIIADVRSKTTRSNALMGFVQLEDLTGQIECLVFPRVWERIGSELTMDRPVVMTGRLSVREDEAPKLIVDAVRPLERASGKGAAPKLFIRVLTRESMREALPMLSVSSGQSPVLFHIESENTTLRASEDFWCNPDAELMRTLGGRFGTDNVKLCGDL
ncbi:MAG: DNA polymerase III subunit alpha, partial [Clostridia bacterium]|nr:DNA polymerase III subunit alpha [Clostridia bacterium]